MNKGEALLRKDELRLDSLNMNELLLQFKVMKALGYKSLFDPDFRREIRNPLRRVLYYKIILAEDSVDKKFLSTVLKGVADRISFFTEPELFKKVKAEEDKFDLENAPDKDAKISQRVSEFKILDRTRGQSSKETTSEAVEFIKAN